MPGPSPRFQPVSSKVSFPDMEEAVLRRWRDEDTFHAVEAVRAGAPLFIFYEGPPTANGSPGIHHVLARAFKDVMIRYKTMRGFLPLRRGGWDTHGLPVELEVERELGLRSKREIEEFGIEEFNRRCRESVFRYVKEWEAVTDRAGVWLDMKDAYVTYENHYIESGWWVFKTLWDRGLMYEGYKVTPHCPRCVTSLSSHEVALGYKDDTPDPSVFVRFPLSERQPLGQNVSRMTLTRLGYNRQHDRWDDAPPAFLVWTTTPWTLTANVALAIAPKEEYALVSRAVDQVTEGSVVERVILATRLIPAVLSGEWQVLERFSGEELAGIVYEPPFGAPLAWDGRRPLAGPASGPGPQARGQRPGQAGQAEPPRTPVPGAPVPGAAGTEGALHAYRVYPADFVTAEEGTGIVHQAPAYGAEDAELGREHGLPTVHTVDLRGVLQGPFPGAGKFVKDADKDLTRDLRERGLLLKEGVYRHTYPFCWRCGTPLLYYAKTSWYIRTTARKDRLVAGNERINWYPEHIKEGRFGEWLRNNVDWAVSRERYWGTPLPIWRCAGCGATRCMGSVAELRQAATPVTRVLVDGLDLHRPYVDRVECTCTACGGVMHRVPEVADAWFDSGAMPFAQWKYPVTLPGPHGTTVTLRNVDDLLTSPYYPADYITEAVDQTRGWFYSLLALSTLISDQPSYRNVICLGLILDDKGEKMSKSRGNVVNPWDVLGAQGADALRWYLYTAAPAGAARRFSGALVQEALRRFLLTLWNTYSFFTTYASLDGFDPDAHARFWHGEPGSPTLAGVPPNELDRWAVSELNGLVRDVTAALERYDPTEAGRRIEEFVDLLSNWYVRRSRRRFWKSENDEDKTWAYATLYSCLLTVSKLMAPLTPFVADEIYRNLAPKNAAGSVHLADYPVADASLVDERVDHAVRLAMRIASLGRAARSKAKIKVRQPLARVLVRARPEEQDLLPGITAQVLDELNVKALEPSEEEAIARFRLRPNLPVLGPKYGKQLGAIRRELEQADSAAVAAQVRAGEPVRLGEFTLEATEVLVEVEERAGLAVAMEGGLTVAVDTRLTDALRAEGAAREMVHRIQNLRRDAGFEVADRIATYVQGADAATIAALTVYGDYVRQETLSTAVLLQPPPPGAYVESQDFDGQQVTLAVVREAGGGG